MRYLLPVLVAAALAAVAIGLAHPAQQTCAEAKAIRVGVGEDEAASKQARSRLEALLKDSAPTCAIEALAGTGAGKMRSHLGVPKQLSGLNAARAWMTDQGLGTTESVLLLVSVLLLMRTALALAISRRAGSVNLDTVTDAASEKPDAAVAAQLRQRLADQHLLAAPLVPGGGLPEAVATTLKETELPNTGWVASLVRSLPNLLPKAGVKIDAVIRQAQSAGEKSACTATLTDLASGRMMAVLTERGDNPLAAADAVVACAIAYILDRHALRRRTPAWSRFGVRSTAALAELTRGDDLLCEPAPSGTTSGHGLTGALACYLKALESDPANLTVALKLGNTLEQLAQEDKTEQAKQRVATATAYLRAYQLWPKAFAPRYRAAIALTVCADSFDHSESELAPLALGSRDACLESAVRLLEELVRDLSWWGVTRQWLETFYSARERKAGTRKYFQRFINPFSLRRRRVRATYRMSVLIAWESLKPEPWIRERQVKKLLCETCPQSYTLLNRLAVNWQVRYNAACYYARRAGTEAADSSCCLQNANRLLTAVLNDPSHEVTGTWLRRDPDLESLRRWETSPWEHIKVIGEFAAPPEQASSSMLPG